MPRCFDTRNSLAAVAGFADGTLLYVLSKMWADLLSIYVFEFQPEPYCSLRYDEPCRAYAPASDQWAYAFALLLVATLLDAIAVAVQERAPAFIALRRRNGATTYNNTMYNM